MKKQYLSQSEQESLQEEKKELESALKEIEGGAGAGTAGSQVDTVKIKREIARINAVIGDGTAPKPKATEQDQLVKEERELEEQIAEGMPTRDEMRHPARNPGAVRKHMEWGNINQKRIQRYVAIQRILRPRDPKSIESLRKDK